VDTPFINNKRWGCIFSGTDALDNSNLLLIAWLNEFRLSTSFKTHDNFYRPNNAYLEACLVKVIYVVVLDTVLNFSFFNKLKPHANYLRIFLEYFLTVLCLIEGYFKFI
jgi:hypothetical protein